MGRTIRRSVQQGIDHRAYWDVPQEGELTYLALGDSAGLGVGVDRPRQGYVGRVVGRLEASTGRTVRAINLSISGATVGTLLSDQIPQLESLPRPDVVTCVVGGNDIAWSWAFLARKFANAMNEVARQLPPGSVLGSVPSFGHWPYEGRVRRANHAINQAAHRYGHSIADLYTPTRRLWPWKYTSVLAGDYFHPNEAGHALWAEAIWAPMQGHAPAA